jgi:hypothetical protein
MKHAEEFIELMNAITNSDRFSTLSKLIVERGGEPMLTILFDEAEAKGEARGKEIGEIIGTVKTYKRIGKMPSEIVSIIMQDYKLKREEAEAYVEQVLGLQKT